MHNVSVANNNQTNTFITKTFTYHILALLYKNKYNPSSG